MFCIVLVPAVCSVSYAMIVCPRTKVLVPSYYIQNVKAMVSYMYDDKWRTYELSTKRTSATTKMNIAVRMY